jgi:hypothetical protein
MSRHTIDEHIGGAHQDEPVPIVDPLDTKLAKAMRDDMYSDCMQHGPAVIDLVGTDGAAPGDLVVVTSHRNTVAGTEAVEGFSSGLHVQSQSTGTIENGVHDELKDPVDGQVDSYNYTTSPSAREAAWQASIKIEEDIIAKRNARVRAEVYAAIDSERDYQDMRKHRDSGAETHSPEEFLLYMQDYLTEAVHAAARLWGPEAKPKIMEIVRKVTALGVACMEQHGAPKRPGHNPENTYAAFDRLSLAERKDILAARKGKIILKPVSPLLGAELSDDDLAKIALPVIKIRLTHHWGQYAIGHVFDIKDVIPHGGNLDCAAQYQIEINGATWYVPADSAEPFYAEGDPEQIRRKQAFEDCKAELAAIRIATEPPLVAPVEESLADTMQSMFGSTKKDDV